MNEEGQDFERLRRLIALKRHEAPPPGYFNQLPGRITDRIARSDAADSPSWLDRLRQLLTERPSYATGAGIAAGCALVAGLVAINLRDPAPAGDSVVAAPTPPMANAIASAPLQPTNSMAPSNSSPGAELFQSIQPNSVPVSHRIENR